MCSISHASITDCFSSSLCQSHHFLPEDQKYRRNPISMKNNQIPFASHSKTFNARFQLVNLISVILFFGFGLCFGMILTFHLKNVSFNLQFTQFSLSTDTEIDNHDVFSSPPPPPPKIRLENYIHPTEVMHDLSDRELIWRASMVPKVAEYPFDRTPKVAFMFLTRGSVLLSPLWEMFFKGYNGLFNIYVHTSGSPSNWTEPEVHSVFHGRRIPSKVRNFLYVKFTFLPPP